MKNSLLCLFLAAIGCTPESEPVSDVDGDGVTVAEGDCDDENPAVNPEATDEGTNGIDEDCDGFDGIDQDEDGFADAATGGTDCDDTDPDIHPDAEEVCDHIDNNCDSRVDENAPLNIYYLDNDGDGYGNADMSTSDCAAPEGYVLDGTDCNDDEYYISPGNPLDFCDGVDNDCDEEIDEDSKADWDLITLQNDIAYKINPDNASMNRTASIPYWADFNSADSLERGQTIAHGFGGYLYDVDICKDTADEIGATGLSGGCGITFGKDGILYGIDPALNELITLDTTTGAATSVGPLGIELGFCGLTYDCTSDRLIGASSSGKQLFEVDPLTGEAHSFVEVNIAYSAMGIDYDPQSRLVRLSNGTSLYEVDLSTGDYEKKGDFTYPGVNDLALMQTCD